MKRKTKGKILKLQGMFPQRQTHKSFIELFGKKMNRQFIAMYIEEWRRRQAMKEILSR